MSKHGVTVYLTGEERSFLYRYVYEKIRTYSWVLDKVNVDDEEKDKLEKKLDMTKALRKKLRSPVYLKNKED